MATSSELERPGSLLRQTLDFVLAGRPLVALAMVWLTTAGHTMNLRELGVAQGWVPAELFSLQTAFLLGIALMLLACPALAQHFGSRTLAEAGLVLMTAAALLNGLLLHAPLALFLAGRLLAGAGGGLVLYFTPHLLPRRWQGPSHWVGMLLPMAGPGVIAAASMVQGTSDWEWGFLFEGALALLSLLLILSMDEVEEGPRVAPPASLAYLPWLTVAICLGAYCMHWGQLFGWLEDTRIVVAALIGTLSLGIAGWLAWPHLDGLALRDNWLRLLLFFYGGLNQYFHGYTMNVYGGLIVNLSTWQRAVLIWSLPLGTAVILVLTRLVRVIWGVTPGLYSAVGGLVLLAIGLGWCHQETLEWPFWQVLNQVDLSWFAAPTTWQLAPGRVVMGAGIGLLLMAADGMVSPSEDREKEVRPYLTVLQLLGGAVGAGLLVNYLLIGHPIQYSYSADRGYIQAEELDQRRAQLRDELTRAGQPAPEAQAETLIYRGVHYEAENLVYAYIYGSLLVVSLLVAGLCLIVALFQRRGERGVSTP